MPQQPPLTPRSKAKSILAVIVKRWGGSRPNRTQLTKTFYFALLYHMREFGYELVDWPVIKLPYGPAAQDGHTLLRELVGENAIVEHSVPAGPYTAYEYEPGDPNRLSRHEANLSSDELKSVDDACGFCRTKGARELSELTHEHSLSWNEAGEGEEMEIYVDLLDEESRQDIDVALSTVEILFRPSSEKKSD